jgi:hypothetical protein
MPAIFSFTVPPDWTTIIVQLYYVFFKCQYLE